MKGFKFYSRSIIYSLVAVMVVIAEGKGFKGIYDEDQLDASSILRSQPTADRFGFQYPNYDSVNSRLQSAFASTGNGYPFQNWVQQRSNINNYQHAGGNEERGAIHSTVDHSNPIEMGSRMLNSFPFAGMLKSVRKRSADSEYSGSYQHDSTKLDSTTYEGQNNNRDAPGAPSSPPFRTSARFPSAFCELELDSGIICPGLRRELHLNQFYYDVDNNRCSHFVYNGCGGNANRFSSLWECTQSCVKGQ